LLLAIFSLLPGGSYPTENREEPPHFIQCIDPEEFLLREMKILTLKKVGAHLRQKF
jgi:hypothetical protein